MATSLEMRAYRAAHKVGLRMVRSRSRHLNERNRGGFKLVDRKGEVIAGHNYEFAPESVIVICEHMPLPVAGGVR